MTAWAIISTVLANLTILLFGTASVMYIYERIARWSKKRKRNKEKRKEKDRSN